MAMFFKVPRNPTHTLGMLYEGDRIVGRIDAEAYSVRWSEAGREFEISAYDGDTINIYYADSVEWVSD